MVRLVGERYADCTFGNFDIGNDRDRVHRENAVSRVKAYAASIQERRASGQNLILIGSCGTGKDHLATAVVRCVLGSGLTVAFARGSALAKEMVDAQRQPEGLDAKYATRDFLFVSDIEPRAKAESSLFFQESILDLIDQRYRSKLPIIITSNVETREDLLKAIGKRAVDRLLEGAVIVRMQWDTYRKVGV
jgi:DNA replication protein DnaC